MLARRSRARRAPRRCCGGACPPAIAERAEAGDRDVVEQVAAATVAVVVIGGLGTLVTAVRSGLARVRCSIRFVEEADDLAAERGLDRVQLSGDAYVAGVRCQHGPTSTTPVEPPVFVLEVREALRDLDPEQESCSSGPASPSGRSPSG